MVRNCYQFSTQLSNIFTCKRTYISVTLQSYLSILNIKICFFSSLSGHKSNTISGSLCSSQRTIKTNGFTCICSRCKVSGCFLMFIYHPCHNLTICSDIRCRNVYLFPNNRSNSPSISPR